MAEALLVEQLERRNIYLMKRNIRDYVNPFEIRETAFIEKFRLSREAVRYLCRELKPVVKIGQTGMPLEIQVLIALRVMGSGSYQNIVGDSAVKQVSQTSVSRYLSKVIAGIERIAKKFIVFPTEHQEINRKCSTFHTKLKFPNAIGAIDCVHVYMNKPFVPDAYAYMNRKGKYSINVQMICDANLQIMDVVARWPGSSHDAMIWAMSGAKHLFENGFLPDDVFLLGDNGYPLEPFLMTPFIAPCCPSEITFNQRQRSARNVIERCFGVLKSRFRIISLSGGLMHYQPKKVCKIIIAVAVLHNISLLFNIENLPPIDDDMMHDEDNEDNPDSQQIDPNAIIRRTQLALYFQSNR